MQIPTIETPRLLLRGHQMRDLKESVRLWQDPIVCRYTVGEPVPAEQSWRRMLMYWGHWTQLGYGYWVVEEKSTGRFVGEVGFGDFKRDITPPLGSDPEAGWVLSSQFHGRGYGSEAVKAMMNWGFNKFGPARTTCLISPENTPSLRLASKFGYREIARSTYKSQASVIFEGLFKEHP